MYWNEHTIGPSARPSHYSYECSTYQASFLRSRRLRVPLVFVSLPDTRLASFFTWRVRNKMQGRTIETGHSRHSLFSRGRRDACVGCPLCTGHVGCAKLAMCVLYPASVLVCCFYPSLRFFGGIAPDSDIRTYILFMLVVNQFVGFMEVPYCSECRDDTEFVAKRVVPSRGVYSRVSRGSTGL